MHQNPDIYNSLLKISLVLKFYHEVGLSIRKQWCRNQQESFMHKQATIQGVQKNLLSDDKILALILALTMR